MTEPRKCEVCGRPKDDGLIKDRCHATESKDCLRRALRVMADHVDALTWRAEAAESDMQVLESERDEAVSHLRLVANVAACQHNEPIDDPDAEENCTYEMDCYGCRTIGAAMDWLKAFDAKNQGGTR